MAPRSSTADFAGNIRLKWFKVKHYNVPNHSSSKLHPNCQPASCPNSSKDVLRWKKAYGSCQGEVEMHIIVLLFVSIDESTIELNIPSCTKATVFLYTSRFLWHLPFPAKAEPAPAHSHWYCMHFTHLPISGSWWSSLKTPKHESELTSYQFIFKHKERFTNKPFTFNVIYCVQKRYRNGTSLLLQVKDSCKTSPVHRLHQELPQQSPLHSCTTNVTTATEETLRKSENQSYQQQCERTRFQTDCSITGL